MTSSGLLAGFDLERVSVGAGGRFFAVGFGAERFVAMMLDSVSAVDGA
jgi:hypothetical protein